MGAYSSKIGTHMSKNIKDMVGNNKKVKFKFYRKGELFYETEDGFIFPVPISDCGDGTFLAEDRAMLFMRYIRQALANTEPEDTELEAPATDTVITSDE